MSAKTLKAAGETMKSNRNRQHLSSDEALATVVIPWGFRVERAEATGKMMMVPLSFDEWWEDRLKERNEPW